MLNVTSRIPRSRDPLFLQEQRFSSQQQSQPGSPSSLY